jgi:UDP-N-acetylglucosamine--N-acetylmuramyl-(pentapeptide) pyrophosphoryl-undecaprenol N-acetylglucosamine transferase
MEQRNLSGVALATRIVRLIAEPARLDAMAAAARRMGRPDAAKVIADKAEELVKAKT